MENEIIKSIQKCELQNSIKINKILFDLFLERRNKPPRYKMNKEGLLVHYLDDQRKLLRYSVKYISKKLCIPYKQVSLVLMNKIPITIDKMIKLCNFLMIPEVEYAYNLNRKPLHYYCGNKFVPKRKYEDDSAINSVHQIIVNEGGIVSIRCLGYSKFVNSFILTPEEKNIILKGKILSRTSIYRYMASDRIIDSDKAMKIVLAINKKIKDFWWWE